MENQTFHNASVDGPEKVPKPVTRNKTGKRVLVDNSVVFVYDTGDTEKYDNIRTLVDVINLHEAKPNVLLGIYPPLYSSFMDTGGKIVTYVKVGDKVKYKNPNHADDKTNPVLTVSDVYFKSLGDMSVVCAEFEEGGYSLTNLLMRLTNGN